MIWIGTEPAMTKFLGALFFLFFTNLSVGYSQNLRVIDSLHASLNTQITLEQFDLLNAIGFEYRYSYPDSTIYYCSRAYEIGKSIQIEKDLSKPLSFVGLAFANKGDYKKSLEYHQQAIDVATQQQDSVQLAFGYNNLGRMFFDGGDMDRAYDNFIRSKDIFEIVQNQSGLAYVYRSLANIYKSQSNFNQAIEMSTKAYELRKKIGDKRSIVSSLLELGLIYEEKGDKKGALRKLQMADSLAKKFNDPVTLAEIELGVAEILLNEKRFEESYTKANSVLKTVSDITNQNIFIRASLIRGKYFLFRKNFSVALPIFDDLVKKAEQSGNIKNQIDATKNLALCYQALGNTNKAKEANVQAEILGERIKNIDLQDQNERLQFRLQIETTERENELLIANQIKSKALISTQQFQNRLLLVIVISVSIVMTIFLIYSRKRKLDNQRLQEQNKKILKQQEVITNVNISLRKQNVQLNEVNDEKDTLMNIVAHDLKSPINRIAGLASIMEMEGGLSAKQEEYVNMIKNATSSGNNLITDLLDVNAFAENARVAVVSHVDLGSLLNQRVNSFQVMADLKSIELSVNHSFGTSFFTDPDFINRIIDNLISNGIKFSPKNSKILISGKIEDKVAVISIKDSGPGFSEADKLLVYQKFKRLSARPTGGESSNGLGLAIVKILVERLRGEVHLRSQKGKGAEFIIKIPDSRNP